MRRTLIVLGSLPALACPPPAVAVPSRAEAGRIAGDFYRTHPGAPPLSGAQSRNGPVRRPVPTGAIPAPPPTVPPVSPPIAPPVPNVVTAPPASGPAAATRQIFKIGNDGGVMNAPTRPSVFVLDQPTLITELTDYHWNNGRGAPAGTIAIRGEDGRTYGPWRATLINGVYWRTSPNVVLPAGRYTVIDSDPATWAQNAGTGGAGMTWAEGAPRAMPPASPPPLVVGGISKRGTANASTAGPPPPPPQAVVRQVFKIGNDAGVMNGPTRPSVFSLDRPTLITELTDYHWNGGRGAPAGTIMLRADDGSTYGPWRATLINGVYWRTSPNVVLPPGRYTVIDSDPATWAQNGGTGGAGMSWAQGIPR